jgi:hypothetical protein
MIKTLSAIAPVLAAISLSACHTTPAADSGFLLSYDGMEAPDGMASASIRQRRDDVASDAVRSVFLEPALFAPQVGDELSPVERSMVLREVDRQICFEVSERFALAPAPTPEAARVRTAVVRLHPTGRAGSAFSAAAGVVVPVINLRVPGTTGGIAIESEMLEAGTGRQIGAISWARNAQAVGMDVPSLSRVGDALQMAEPMGDAVGDAFATKAREVTENPEPDPCVAFGPRLDIGRAAAGFAVNAVTGLYSPEAAGTGARPAVPEE